jgi:hypothetical protein
MPLSPVPDLLKITERERHIVLTSLVDTLPAQRDDVALEVGTCRPKRCGDRGGEAGTWTPLLGGTDRTSDLQTEGEATTDLEYVQRSSRG